MHNLNENSIVRLNDGKFALEVRVAPEEDTVWLTQEQIAQLFDKDRSTITGHIGKIFKEGELKEKSNVGFINIANSDKSVKVYSLDLIISVGYRVKSKRGIQFRKWANKILKDYLIKGYSVNQKRFDFNVFENAIKMLDNAKLDDYYLIEAEQMLGFLHKYVKALRLLDEFDHRTIEKPIGSDDVYVLTYEECRKIIEMSSFKDTSENFAMEKDSSFHSSINAIYQTFDEKMFIQR